MKKTILFLFVSGLGLTSCMKSKTCTCNDPAGNLIYQETKKTNNRSDLKKFEDDCKKSGFVTTTSSGSTTTHCEIS